MSKTCVECNKEFNQSGRHKKCGSCRQYKPCPMCGKKKTRAANFCNECTDRSGELNGNWKGGQTYHKKGYVMSRTEDGKYVFSHILIMESILGRKLLPEENVHHKNGIKDDNRPENLELWVVNQPCGQRVEDLVAWAKNILERYDT